MTITSPNFNDNALIPSLYTCDGENLSPALKFTDIPKNTKSLAIIMEDPDAPGGTFYHWLLWNIDPGSPGLGEGEIPQGANSGTNSSGKQGYIGPCPPNGTHHYIFHLYALSDTLDLDQETSAPEFKQILPPHIIDHAALTGLFTR